MTPVALEDSVYVHFGTTSVSTGAATDADSTPTVTIEEDGAALGYSPTVTNVAVGLYRVQINATAANGFEVGRRYSVYVAATVGAVVGRDSLGEFEVLTTSLDTLTARIDVILSTRLATAGYTAPDNATIALIDAKTTNLPSDPADQSLIIAATVAIQADTDDIQARLPAALVGGRMDASVGAMAADVVTAAALAADAAAEIRDAILDAVIEGAITLRQGARLWNSALGGKASGLETTTALYRDLGDTKDRITATVDANGNRTAVTLDLA